MRSTLAATIGAVIALALPLAGQAPAVFAPIDVRVPVSPRPFVAAGATHLEYELHITNLSSRPTMFEAVDVMDQSGSPDAPPLLHLEGDALGAALRLLGAPPDEAVKRVLPGGRTALLFVWVTVQPGAVPKTVTHRFALRLGSADAPTSLSQGHSAHVTEANLLSVCGVEVPVSAKGTTCHRTAARG